MKKVFRILLIFSILCVSGCDFLRRVAGRPTSAELQDKAAKLEAIAAKEAEKKAQIDTAALREAEMKAAAALEEEINAALHELSRKGVTISSAFGYGKPLEPIRNKYNIVAGVFRNAESAENLVQKAKAAGFGAYLTAFSGGVNAFFLDGGDNPKDFADKISRAIEEGLCPSDTWIYVKKD